MKAFLIAAGIALGTLGLGASGPAEAAPLAASAAPAHNPGLAQAGLIEQAQYRGRRNWRRGPPRRCREVVTRRVNRFGRVVVSRRVVCNRGRYW